MSTPSGRWAGDELDRDRAAVLAHIRELEEMGVARPPSVPAIYQVSAGLVTSEPRLVVGSSATSGEAEFYLIKTPLGVLIGVGSDHTDRQHETIDIAESKGMCGKVELPTERVMIFGGTLTTAGGFVYASRFEVELRDSVLNRTLGIDYDILVEPG